MRLDKYLSDAGIGTRSQVKKMIAAGRVHVNGVLARQASMQLDERTADVTADGERVRYVRFEYYMLNKPRGVISASRVPDGTEKDVAGEVCVVDLITDRIRDDLFPVGRLDRDTEGLLLITNDGQLAHALLSPHHHVDKIYDVWTDAPLRGEERERLESGIDIGDEKITLPCWIERISQACPCADDAGYSCRVTIREGRYHQIKRMFAAVGLTVTSLKRLSMGPLTLDEALAPGEYRPLTENEVRQLREAEAVNRHVCSADTTTL